jgi:hypothetical protein
MTAQERINHAAEAQQLLDAKAHGGTQAEKVLLLQGAMQAAQVHATLALVEQQRIANLLAYYSVDDVIGGGPGSAGALEDIEKGLGL